MKSIRTALMVMAVFTATALMAHQGHQHRILGTVKALHENDLVLENRDGGEKTVTLTADSKLTRGGEIVDRSALREGLRVSVEVNNQDEVLNITLGKEN